MEEILHKSEEENVCMRIAKVKHYKWTIIQIPLLLF